MAAGETRAPQADALRINDVQALRVADGPPPVGNLAPRVGILPRQALAGAEATVVVKQNDEARFGEGPCEGLDFMLLHTGIAMRHGDCGAPALTCRHVKPAAQLSRWANVLYQVPSKNADRKALFL
jgi:hypothetical protein